MRMVSHALEVADLLRFPIFPLRPGAEVRSAAGGARLSRAWRARQPRSAGDQRCRARNGVAPTPPHLRPHLRPRGREWMEARASLKTHARLSRPLSPPRHFPRGRGSLGCMVRPLRIEFPGAVYHGTPGKTRASQIAPDLHFRCARADRCPGRGRSCERVHRGFPHVAERLNVGSIRH